jgi:hypothetical protein
VAGQGVQRVRCCGQRDCGVSTAVLVAERLRPGATARSSRCRRRRRARAALELRVRRGQGGDGRLLHRPARGAASRRRPGSSSSGRARALDA